MPKDDSKAVVSLVAKLYGELLEHDGYGEIRVELRLLKRNQKEVIVHCGKQYRFVVDWAGAQQSKGNNRRHSNSRIEFPDRRKESSDR